MFNSSQVVRHGFPFEPSAMAYDPVQNILAVGTKNGSLRMYPFFLNVREAVCFDYDARLTVCRMYM